MNGQSSDTHTSWARVSIGSVARTGEQQRIDPRECGPRASQPDDSCAPRDEGTPCASTDKRRAESKCVARASNIPSRVVFVLMCSSAFEIRGTGDGERDDATVSSL